MGVVKGAICIKDNATAVLKSIRQEQTAFRKDVEKTRKELTSTWNKQYKAKLEATTAMKRAKELKSKLEPLRKKVITAIAVKDLAIAKVKAVTNRVKAVGKMVAKPVVNVVIKGAQGLASIGKGMAGAAKVAAVGLGAVGVAGAAALKAIYSGSEDAAKAQIEAETKLEAVLGNVKSIQAKGAGAAQQAKQQLMGVASEMQQVGVIGDEVTLAGMQQLATFQLSDKEISTLATGMTDLLAQQKGLNASQQDAVGIGNMIGKVMQGQTGALSEVGITFDKAQEKAMKTGDAEQRAAVLAEILQQNVGGVNKALAETDQGKIQQMSNAYGDMKEEVGKLVLSMKSKLASVIMKNIPMIQKLGTTMMSIISKFANKAMPIIDKVITNVTPAVEAVLGNIGSIAEEIIPIVSNIFNGLQGSAETVRPILMGILNGFVPLIPQLVAFGGSIFSTIQQIITAVMPAVASIITTVQNVIPVILPVLETVISTIGSVISQAAPIIAGMVEGIGVVVSTLAPIFNVIFTEIGEKVGSVISFIGERMGFIKEVIETAAPLIGSIISTAWDVISPVLDIAIGAFELVFAVVEKVFPGIQSVIETVWGIIQPIVEGIGGALGTIADGWDWLVGKVTGKSTKGAEVGKNADGDNNWRGGLTWVGEKGAELVDLPKGSRILPHKESVSYAQQSSINPVAKEKLIHSVIKVPDKNSAVNVSNRIEGKNTSPSEKIVNAVTVTIAKLADTIIVREESDIEKISTAVAKKIIAVASNMA